MKEERFIEAKAVRLQQEKKEEIKLRFVNCLASRVKLKKIYGHSTLSIYCKVVF